MFRDRKIVLMSAIAILLLAACSQTTSEPSIIPLPTKTVMSGDNTLTIWSTFNDQNPQNDEDMWLAGILAAYNRDRSMKVTNEFQNYDQIGGKLNLAVTSGGDTPDLANVHSQQLGFYARNGILR